MAEENKDRRVYGLSDDDLEKIAIRAKELALQDIYIAVGRSVIAKILWVLGAAAAAVAAYIHWPIKT